MLGADLFTYDIGGNTSAGIDNVDVSYASFVQNTLGVTLPVTGVVSGGAKVIGAPAAMQAQNADGTSLGPGLGVVLVGLSSLDANMAAATYA